MLTGFLGDLSKKQQQQPTNAELSPRVMLDRASKLKALAADESDEEQARTYKAQAKKIAKQAAARMAMA